MNEPEARMDSQIEQSEPAPGVEELLVPGEAGERRRSQLTARGVVPLGPASWRILATRCESLSVTLPEVVGADGDLDAPR